MKILSPSQPASQASELEQFEAWAKRHGYTMSQLSPHIWAAWQARAALSAPPQAAPHAAPLLPTQAALNSPRIDMPPSLSPEEKGAFMLGVAAGNVAAPHAVLVEARDALKSLHDGIAEYARMNLLSGFDNHDMKRARAAIASIERTLSQTQEPVAFKSEDALDAKRLDWLMRRVSESAFRDIGIVWPAWSPQSRRADIDAAMKEPNA
jgi:hypothetical protein